MTKEQVYDSEISPLMAQILDICTRNEIAMLASFHLPDDEQDDLLCTSALLADEWKPPHQMVNALAMIRPPERKPLHYRIENGDGTVEMGAIL